MHRIRTRKNITICVESSEKQFTELTTGALVIVDLAARRVLAGQQENTDEFIMGMGTWLITGKKGGIYDADTYDEDDLEHAGLVLMDSKGHVPNEAFPWLEGIIKRMDDLYNVTGHYIRIRHNEDTKFE